MSVRPPPSTREPLRAAHPLGAGYAAARRERLNPLSRQIAGSPVTVVALAWWWHWLGGGTGLVVALAWWWHWLARLLRWRWLGW